MSNHRTTLRKQRETKRLERKDRKRDENRKSLAATNLQQPTNRFTRNRESNNRYLSSYGQTTSVYIVLARD